MPSGRQSAATIRVVCAAASKMTEGVDATGWRSTSWRNCAKARRNALRQSSSGACETASRRASLLLEGDNDLASCTTGGDVFECRAGLLERVTLVDDGFHAALAGQVRQVLEVGHIDAGNEGHQLLVDEMRQQLPLAHVPQRPDPGFLLGTADAHENALRLQGIAQGQQPVVARGVENEVVTPRPLREIILGVVDDV